MTLWDVPSELEIGVIPKKIYCNKDLIALLKTAFLNIIGRGLIGELRTWDGCFNIRKKRGATTASLHSWGIAVDINAAWNGFGKQPTMSPALVACLRMSALIGEAIGQAGWHAFSAFNINLIG